MMITESTVVCFTEVYQISCLMSTTKSHTSIFTGLTVSSKIPMCSQSSDLK